MKTKVVHTSNQKFIDKIKKIVEDKIHIHQMIRKGKLSEISSDIKFVKPL